MTIRVIRAGEHIQHIPGYGISVRESGVAVVSNWWEVAGKTCVVAYQPKGAASYAASLVNLATPGTNDANGGVAPGWAAATGWAFGGTHWLECTYATALLPVTFITRVKTPNGNTRHIIASRVNQTWTEGNTGFRVNATGKIELLKVGVGQNRLSEGTIGDNLDTVVAGSNSTAGAWAFYFDGSVSGTGNNALTPNGYEVLIGAAAYGDGIYEPFVGNIMALAIWTDVLTASEVATVSAAMAAL